MADDNLLTGQVSDEQLSREDVAAGGPTWWNLLQALPGAPKRAVKSMLDASLTEMLQGAGHMVKSGATAAGDAARGTLQMTNPLTGHTSDEGIRRAQDMYLGTQMMGLPVAAAAVPANSLGTLIGKSARTWNPELAETARVAERMGASPDQVWNKTGYSGQGFADNMLRSELSDAGARIDMSTINKPITKVGNMLEHADLYRAYPEMANKLVIKEPMANSAMLGGHDPLTGNITLNSLRLPGMEVDNLRKLMLHEVGHGIEQKEGFARGGNMQEFLPQDFDTRYQAASERAREAGRGTGADLLQILGKHGIDPTKAGEIMQQFARGMPEKMPSTEMLEKYHPKVKGFLSDIYSHKKILDMAKVIKTDLLPLEDMRLAAEENYRRLTGEVHQRAVMDRSWMTPQELRDLAPWHSFDRPREKQIVRF